MKLSTKALLSAIAITVVTAGLLSFQSMKNGETASLNQNSEYLITNTVSSGLTGSGQYEWVWSVSNPNPGNGQNGTLRDISHWSLPLPENVEASLIASYYSYDGITWYSNPIAMDRDPSIRYCTGQDVLKFDYGTTGTAPLYAKIVVGVDYEVSPYTYSYIKTGGGLAGCYLVYHSGVSAGQRND